MDCIDLHDSGVFPGLAKYFDLFVKSLKSTTSDHLFWTRCFFPAIQNLVVHSLGGCTQFGADPNPNYVIQSRFLKFSCLRRVDYTIFHVIILGGGGWLEVYTVCEIVGPSVPKKKPCNPT